MIERIVPVPEITERIRERAQKRLTVRRKIIQAA
jgi:hypothetical protein